MLEVYGTAFLTICLVELTDRTRILAMVLSTRYKTPYQLILGMTLGYIPAISVAVFGAQFLRNFISDSFLQIATPLVFIGVGLILWFWKDQPEEEKDEATWLAHLKRQGAFWVGFVLVAMTEFGDKSQFATAGMMLEFAKAWPVFLGSLSAQAVLNVIYVFAGQLIGDRLPIVLIKKISGLFFVVLGVLMFFLR
jgi:putative Ca2+/H+ antiporter (TMEM165/GDT1 family)